MVLITNDSHPTYYRHDLHVYNMLQHPIWVFDVDHLTMYWANTAALRLWNATTIEELLQRDFVSDMSDTAKSFLHATKNNHLIKNETIIEQWTFYPQGLHAVTTEIYCSAIPIDDNHRIAMLVEAEIMDCQHHQQQNQNQNEPSIHQQQQQQQAPPNRRTEQQLRSMEILKHLPIAVSQYTMDGIQIYQNPQANELFGDTILSRSSTNNRNTIDDSNNINSSNSRNNINGNVKTNTVSSSPSATVQQQIQETNENIINECNVTKHDNLDDPIPETPNSILPETYTNPIDDDTTLEKTNNNRYVSSSIPSIEEFTDSSSTTTSATTILSSTSDPTETRTDTTTTTTTTTKPSATTTTTTTSICTIDHILLQRFVDINIANVALQHIQSGIDFCAEAQQYIITQQQRSHQQPITQPQESVPSSSSSSTTTTLSPVAEQEQNVSNLTDHTKSNNSHIKKTSSMNALCQSNSSRGDDDDQNDRDNETTRWFNVSIRRTRDPVTSEYVIVYIARDISDIVKARKDTTRAALKSEFLDVMAHEIRTPLHQIVGHVDLLEDSELNKDQLLSVQQIQNSSSLLMSIINDLLDCSKLERGHVEIEAIPFALDTLIHACVSSIRPQSDKKQLTLSSQIDPTIETNLISDPNRLRQILNNLLSNAVKFTNSGAITVTVKPCTITTSASTRTNRSSNTVTELVHITEKYKNVEMSDSKQPDSFRQRIRVEVSDTGIGMSRDEQTVVFERYQQANASVSRHYGGTGLGLPICKGLVELMGGSIGIISELGKGTTVFFEIPFRVAQQSILTNKQNQTQTGLKALTTPPNLHSMQVLVVEDNIVNQKVVKAMLQRLGHIVSVAENGQLALDQINHQQFHLVLMDIQMPVMDGIECTKYIRNVLQINKRQLPIVGLTAGYQHSDQFYYVNDVGMNDCLGKPLKLEALKKAIACYQSSQSLSVLI